MRKRAEKAALCAVAALAVLIVCVGLVGPSLVSAASDLSVVAGFIVAGGGVYAALLLLTKAYTQIKLMENDL